MCCGYFSRGSKRTAAGRVAISRRCFDDDGDNNTRTGGGGAYADEGARRTSRSSAAGLADDSLTDEGGHSLNRVVNISRRCSV